MSKFSQEQKDFLENLFTKLNSTINEKTNEIREEIKEKVDELKEEVKESQSKLETQIQVLKEENKKLIETTLRLERKVRKNNIAVFGIEENESDLTRAVCHIFVNNLDVDINRDEINDTYRIGNPKKAPVIVEFVSYQRKLDVIKNTKKLKGSKISITSDLCYEDRKDRKILVKHLKNARNKGFVAYLKGGKLIVSDEVYTVQDLISESQSEKEYTSEIAYMEQPETELGNRPQSAPSTPDPVTRGKRHLEEEETEERTSKKKTKEESKTKSSVHAIKTRSNSQKS